MIEAQPAAARLRPAGFICYLQILLSFFPVLGAEKVLPLILRAEPPSAPLLTAGMLAPMLVNPDRCLCRPDTFREIGRFISHSSNSWVAF